MKKTLVAVVTLFMVAIMATSTPVFATNEIQEVTADTPIIIGHFMITIIKEDGFAVYITLNPDDTGSFYVASIMDGTTDEGFVLSKVTSISQTDVGVKIEWECSEDDTFSSPLTIIGAKICEIAPY